MRVVEFRGWKSASIEPIRSNLPARELSQLGACRGQQIAMTGRELLGNGRSPEERRAQGQLDDDTELRQIESCDVVLDYTGHTTIHNRYIMLYCTVLYCNMV